MNRSTKKGPLRIAGSGPSGLAAAIELARRGHQVELHERRDRAASRFWGGHQILAHYGPSPRPGELLESLGVEPSMLEGRWLHAATFHLPGGGTRHFEGPVPFARLVRRGAAPGALDAALLKQARELGVRVFEKSRLEEPECCIAATGPDHVTGMALEILYQTDADDRVDVLLDPKSFGEGYAYLLVHQGWATLGVAALSDYRNLEEMAEHALCRFDQNSTMNLQEQRRGKHTMRYGMDEHPVNSGVFRVGEAAGVQDFLFGLGIGSALQSGRLAAQCLDEGTSYETRLRREMWSRMRASEVDRWLYERGWLGWCLMRVPRNQLARGLDWLHRGNRWRAPASRWLGRHR